MKEPEPRAGHIAVAVGKNIVVWGGYNDDPDDPLGERYHPADEVWIWDVDIGLWSARKTSGSVPPGLSGASSVVVIEESDCSGRQRHLLYVIGGHGNEGNVNTVFQLNFRDMKWTNLSTTIMRQTFSPRDKFVAWEFDGNIYIFGGFGPDFHHLYLDTYGEFAIDQSVMGRGWNNQLLMMDLKTSAWTMPRVVGAIPLPRAAHAIAKINDRVYMFGGRHNQVRLGDVHSFDSSTVTWTRIEIIGSHPVGRSWHSFTPISESSILLFGGYSNYDDEQPLDDAWLFDVDAHQWTQLEHSVIRSSGSDETRCRVWHTGTQAASGEVMVFGGCIDNILYDPDSRNTNEVITFRISPKSLSRLCIRAAFDHRDLLQSGFQILPHELRDSLLAWTALAASTASL